MTTTVPEHYTYLDWAATAPLGEEAAAAMAPYLAPGLDNVRLGMNANSLHAPGRAAFEAMELLRRQMASGIDIIIHLARFRDRSRRAAQIVEVGEYRDGEIELHPLYVFEEEKGQDPTGKVRGELKKHEDLKNKAKLESAGLSLP